MKCWGIYNKKTDSWIEFTNGQIFWTSSRSVAEIQFKRDGNRDGWAVAAFPEDDLEIPEAVWGWYATNIGWVMDVQNKPLLFSSRARAQRYLENAQVDDKSLSETSVRQCELQA